jgi:hypothetical protein
LQFQNFFLAPHHCAGVVVVCLAAIAYYNAILTLIFFAGLALGLALFILAGRNKIRLDENLLLIKD